MPGRQGSLRPRGIKPKKYKLSLSDMMMAQGEGNTTLERTFSGACKEANIRLDQKQYRIPLTFAGQYTVADFVTLAPQKICWFVDGIQHELRPEREQEDVAQASELKEMGWTVIRVNWRELADDPVATVRQKYYMLVLQGESPLV